MIDVDLTPARAPTPSAPRAAFALPALGQLPLWLALIGMGGYIAHSQLRPAPPTVSTFTASYAAYRSAQPANLVAVGKLIQSGTLDTAVKIDAELAGRAAPVAAAVKAVVSAHCDKDTGKVTDPAGLAAEFVAAGQAAGGK